MAGEGPQRVHVHDPGRLPLLRPGTEVLVRRAASAGRATAWDLLAFRLGGEWVFAHSGYHRVLAERILADGRLSPLGPASGLRREVARGRVRVDFLLRRADGRRVWVEVKGCTLVSGGVALFPDAPTLRGRRQLEELVRALGEGDGAALLVLVFVPARAFAPHREVDPRFAEALWSSVEAGLALHPLLLSYDGTALWLQGRLPVVRA